MRPSFIATMTLLAGCGGSTAPGNAPTSRADSGAASDVSSDASSYTSSANGLCAISASNYDQSCAVDSDCTMITSGDYCSKICLCGGSAINVGAVAQFDADFAKTPIGSGALDPLECFCPLEGPACCRAGACTTSCSSRSDTLPACADAGGTCMASNVACGQSGPPNACAYADETCCIAPASMK